ncbi:DNA-binding response regulator [Pilimelia terevasa]|uniref:DNA-binding response regulator n=1 Tax=Pilimelia terevasa TaxID=53372 RepID=A0A8J3BIJ3_9ACTN|nr:response regulator transcription factor [Pilimelia terevasa]GGK12782.1 DNA-binding response regulator [Pilimelia terevasa]
MSATLAEAPGVHVGTDWLRLMLVDDHTLFREGLAELLGIEADVRVVAQAADSETAVRLAAAARPDAVLLDVEMPFAPVQETIARLHDVCPTVRVLILTMHDDPLLATQVIEAGAHGLLAKSITRQQLMHAVRAVAYRDELVPPPLRRPGDSGPPPTVLSPRERQVLELAGQALSNAQIGARLFITEGTVKRHLTNIYAKLGAVSRLDAVNKAAALRWIRPRVP